MTGTLRNIFLEGTKVDTLFQSALNDVERGEITGAVRRYFAREKAHYARSRAGAPAVNLSL